MKQSFLIDFERSAASTLDSHELRTHLLKQYYSSKSIMVKEITNTMTTSVSTKNMKEACEFLRTDCKQIETNIRFILKNISNNKPVDVTVYPSKDIDPEVPANLMLAIRHLEDARMRLGKAIQYSGDGISIYDNMR